MTAEFPEVLFDPDWYLRTYPDVGASGIDPLGHYRAAGRAEGRAPGAWLDPDWYARLREQAVGAGPAGDVLADYLTVGLPAGIPPSPNCPTRLVAQWAQATTADPDDALAQLAADVAASIAGAGWAAGGPPVALDALLADPGPARERLPEQLFEYARLGLAGVLPGAPADRPNPDGPRLLLDAGSLVGLSGPVTGVERVLTSLIAPAIDGWPGPVFGVSAHASGYQHRLDLVPMLGGAALPGVGESGIAPHAGDWLLGIDVKFDQPAWPAALAAVHAAGVQYCQVVHDLLPVQFPEFFPPWVVAGFTRFLTTVAESASVVLCDSKATEAAYRDWVGHSGVAVLPGQRVTWFPLGSDFIAGTTDSAAEPTAAQRPRVLAVGTIEPRKAYEVLLDAAQALWDAGVEVEFIIVGRKGWALPEVLDRLATLSDSPAPLTWLPDASDAQLQAEYAAADLLVAPSRGEGFGLPVVEAIRAGVPVLARDLPVFRELLGPAGAYFELDRDLPGRISSCLAHPAPAQAEPGRLVSWQDSATHLIAQLRAAAQASAVRPRTGC